MAKDESPYVSGGAPIEEFVNPYTFVRTPRREGAMADRRPDGHDSYAGRRYGGHVTIELTARTPLLLPDQSRRGQGKHGVPALAMRRTPDGSPLLTGSTVKGLLRSTYEAVTSSRFGAFTEDEELPFRAKGRNDSTWVVIWDDTPDGGKYGFLCEPYGVDPGLNPAPFGIRPMAARLEEHDGKKTATTAVPVSRESRDNGFCAGFFREAKGLRGSRWWFLKLTKTKVMIPARAVKRYQRSLKIQLCHHDGTETPGRPHVSPSLAEDYMNLAKGVALRADIERRDGVAVARDIRPAAEGATVTEWTPKDLTPDHVLPPRTFDEFSPAERLFGGITSASGTTHGESTDTDPYRGHIRVRQATCVSGGAGAAFTPPLPLGPLSSPRRMPARFYFGGPDQAPGEIDPGALSPQRHAIRGRKVYMTHRAVIDGRRGDDYWSPTQPADGPTREYLAHREVAANVRSDLNEWIEPGTVFRVRIDLDAAPFDELVPLLWILERLCDRQNNAHLQLGMGKPYGFGAVHVSIVENETRILSTASMTDRWSTLGAASEAPAIPEELATAVQQVQLKVLRNETPQIQDLLVALRGVANHPVHYPKTRGQQGPIYQGFKWFSQTAEPLPRPGGTLRPPAK